MVEGESPRIIFDMVMTRFEEWYNPRIIYDASCKVSCTYDSFYGTLYVKLLKAKEVGLNREPERFMKIQLASDPLHIFNHTTCGDSFHSSLYEDLKPLNKEACEQFNSVLRNAQTSLTYMSFENYMAAMRVFVAFRNYT